MHQTRKRYASQPKRIHEPFDAIRPAQTSEQRDEHFERVVVVVKCVELLSPVCHTRVRE